MPRSWDNTTDEQKRELRVIFALNSKLARAYQAREQLREVLRSATKEDMEKGWQSVLRRTARRGNVPMRKLHDSLRYLEKEILAWVEHRPPPGRVEALNNNGETLVRVSRGCRDLQYLRRKLRFMVANPIRSGDGVRRFLALGLPAPRKAA